ncbi:MAG TPA: restriction endonuclease [Parachlamydiales bacterium]|nr:restriction endonuclease [Parachlamydiales bacterium]
MKLLLSNKRPLATKESRFFDVFECNCASADSLLISTGYVSIDSILYLRRNIENGAISNLDLIIGMQGFDGFTRSQYEASADLAQYLRESGKGVVSISAAFPYHGKIYCFQKHGNPFAAILGSSNLTSVGLKDPLNYEADILLEDQEVVSRLSKFHGELKQKSCKPFYEWKPKSFLETLKIPGAKKLAPKEFFDFWRRRTDCTFTLPLKAEAKSNLNASFGKGRENRNGFVRERPWLEAEIIVPIEITAMPGYPKLSEFKVVTEDGYSFFCKTSGAYSKNFRSKDDLSTLGGWIKDKLVNVGLLKVGSLVTEDILKKFNKELRLIKTENPDVWLLELKEI